MSVVLASFPWEPITPAQSLEKHSLGDYVRLVFEYQIQLREFILEYLLRNTFLDLPSDWTIFDRPHIPLRDMYNMVENNLRLLIATDIVLGMQFTRIWHGGTLDERFLDFTDVNRWFETLQLHLRYIQSLQRRYFITNTYMTGAPTMHQAIGLPQIH